MNRIAILEGLLFIAGDDGLSINQIKNILEISNDEVKELVESIKKNYNDGEHGIVLSYLGERFKFTTKKEYSEYYRKLVNNDENNILSPAALETLAIIAYNEPITRVKVDELRGVSSAHIVRKLLAKNLIIDCGKSELPGKPMLYKTTREFLDYLGLASLNDLPTLNEIDDKIYDDELDLYESNKTKINDDIEILE